MILKAVTSFSPTNRRMLGLLTVSHLAWSGVVLALWSLGQLIESGQSWWALLFVLLQLFVAAQLLLPALRLHPEERGRSFYLFWGAVLVAAIWLINQISPSAGWTPLLTSLKSGLLMLAATLTGAAMARYVHRLWEVVPVCLVMTLADFVSWLYGPTAFFSRVIENYYRAPAGPPPLVDMILVKLAFPGAVGLAPVFGVSDWIMVVFFAIVARRHGVNDNLFGVGGEQLAQRAALGRYLPVSVLALLAAMLLAQISGLFVPALPVVALVMLLWYSGRYLLLRYVWS